MRRILSFFGLILSLVAFTAFIALIYGSWWAKHEADRQVTDAAGKANSALDVAGKAVTIVKDVIARAEKDLDDARKTAAPPVGPPPDPFMRLVVTQANRQLPSDMERARVAVGIASETAVVVQSALNVFDDRPDEQAALGIHPDQMKKAHDQLHKATTELHKARSVLGLPLSHPDAKLTDEEYQIVFSAIDQGKEITGKLDEAITNARTRVDTAKRKAEIWSLRLAIGVSVLGGLGALGQLFMARACIRGLCATPA
jgi:hypothetical protein